MTKRTPVSPKAQKLASFAFGSTKKKTLHPPTTDFTPPAGLRRTRGVRFPDSSGGGHHEPEHREFHVCASCRQIVMRNWLTWQLTRLRSVLTALEDLTKAVIQNSGIVGYIKLFRFHRPYFFLLFAAVVCESMFKFRAFYQFWTKRDNILEIRTKSGRPKLAG